MSEPELARSEDKAARSGGRRTGRETRFLFPVFLSVVGYRAGVESTPDTGVLLEVVDEPAPCSS